MESFNQQEILLRLEQFIQKTRKRLFIMLVFLILGSIAGYYIAPLVMRYLFAKVGQVIFISPAEGFVTQIKMAVVIGFVLAFPLILYLIILMIRERFPYSAARHTFLITLSAYLLFLLGGSFAFFAVLPLGINFLLGFATLELQPMLSAARYISFALVMVLVFGFMFELPLIIFLLTRMGLLSTKTLQEKRKYVILLIFVLAGFLTPPDVVSQILMAIPLLILYEVSIFLARVTEGKQQH